MSRIVVVDSPEGAGRDLAVERALFPADAEVRQITWRGDAARLAEACSDADAVLTDYAVFDREVLGQMPCCRVISVAATGWDCVDVEVAKELGISVCCVGEYCTDEVADHTLALILLLNRRLPDYHAQVQKRKIWTWDEVSGIQRLSGRTLGIVGLGRIGQAVARRAAGFGLEVIAYDPWLAQSGGEQEIPLVDWDDLLERSDIISLHCNMSADNLAMIDAEAFSKMGRKPLLINVARGALIDEAALIEALDAGQIAGAGLDVLADEPPELENHPFLGRNNVIITPHVAFNSEQSLHDNRRISALNITNFLAGRIDEVYRFVHHAGND